MIGLTITCSCRSISVLPVVVLLGFVTRIYPTHKHTSFAWTEAAQQTPPLTASQNRRAKPGPGSDFFCRRLATRPVRTKNLQKRQQPKQPDSGNAPYTEGERHPPAAPGLARGRTWVRKCLQPNTTCWLRAARHHAGRGVFFGMTCKPLVNNGNFCARQSVR